MGDTSRKGFASMDPDKQRVIARAGGLAAHADGRGRRFTPEEAREAGKLGGQKVSSDRAHMAEIGRKGAAAREKNRIERERRANRAAHQGEGTVE